MDLIVAACRTLASRPRLRLLHAIYAAPAITVRDLANAVAQPPAATSRMACKSSVCEERFRR